MKRRLLPSAHVPRALSHDPFNNPENMLDKIDDIASAAEPFPVAPRPDRRADVDLDEKGVRDDDVGLEEGPETDPFDAEDLGQRTGGEDVGGERWGVDRDATADPLLRDPERDEGGAVVTKRSPGELLSSLRGEAWLDLQPTDGGWIERRS